jgi:hypothetical protein
MESDGETHHLDELEVSLAMRKVEASWRFMGNLK